MIDEVLTAVTGKVGGLALSLGGAALPVNRGKQPVQEEGTGAAAQVTVYGDPRPKSVTRFTNQHDLYTYRVQVTYWTPGGRDNVGDLPTLSAWEDAIEKAFCRKPADLLGLDGLRDVRAETSAYLDRGGFVAGWDVSSTDVEVDLVRTRVTPP